MPLNNDVMFIIIELEISILYRPRRYHVLCPLLLVNLLAVSQQASLLWTQTKLLRLHHQQQHLRTMKKMVMVRPLNVVQVKLSFLHLSILMWILF